MRQLLCFILLVLLAYGGSRIRQKKGRLSWFEHLFATGFIFCFFGYLLGPAGAAVIGESMLLELQPLIVFCLGWIGFLVGMQADLSLLKQVPWRFWWFTLAQNVITVVAVTLIFVFLLPFFGLEGRERLLVALLIGACAGVSSQAIPAMAHRNKQSGGYRLLQVASGLDDIPTLFLVMVVFAYSNRAGDISGFWMGITWSAVTLSLGLGFGLLFYLLLRPRARFDETMAICLGVTLLCSGAAAYLHLAIPCMGFAAGFLIANSPATKKQTFYNVLTVAERPIVFLMFLLAGANLRFEGTSWLIPLVIYVFVRGTSKVLGGTFLGKRLPDEVPKEQSIGWGLIAPGPLSVAVALDYVLIENGPGSELLAWIVVTGALTGELAVPYALKRLNPQTAERQAT